MAFDGAQWVWINGDMVPWGEANVHISTHALHYGSGVFEGIRCYGTDLGPAIFRLDEHIERLWASAAIYRLRIPFSEDDLKEAICEVVRRNHFSDCYIRPICFFGSGGLSLDPRNCPASVAVLAWRWKAYLGGEGLRSGVRVTISLWRKFSSRMMPSTAKACGQYVNSILAVQEAVSRGYDEAILLDADGYLAEGAGENLFIVRGQNVITNDQRNSILLGITRDSVMQIARDLGYKVEVRSLTSAELLKADEAFFTGTAAEVTPIREVDGRKIGHGKFPITRRIQQAFFDAVTGKDSQYLHWLTTVFDSRRKLVVADQRSADIGA